jgi:hypothetical protein
VLSTDITIMMNTLNVTFVMNTSGESISMTEITTMGFQSVVITHETDFMTLCLVHLD